MPGWMVECNLDLVETESERIDRGACRFRTLRQVKE